jgi:hypothetical protein
MARPVIGKHPDDHLAGPNLYEMFGLAKMSVPVGNHGVTTVAAQPVFQIISMPQNRWEPLTRMGQ